MAHTCWNSNKYIPQLSLLLWRKIVAVRCFVWPPALRLWSGWQARSFFFNSPVHATSFIIYAGTTKPCLQF